MSRRQITARHLAAAVEVAVLVGALAACAAATGNSAAAPAAGTSVAAANTAGTTQAAGGSASRSSGGPDAAHAGTADSNSTGADPADPTADVSGSNADLTIKDNVVSPASLTVSPGEHLAIANSDAVAHDLSDSTEKLSSGALKAESTGSLIAPKSAGTYRLTDPSHPGTRVTLVVK